MFKGKWFSNAYVRTEFLVQICVTKYFENNLREFKFVKQMKLRIGVPLVVTYPLL